MSTEKIDLSLDDIIKLKGNKKTVDQKPALGNNKADVNNKKKTGSKGAGARAGARRGPPAKNARVVLANKVLKRSKAIMRRAGVNAQQRALGARGRPVATTGLTTVATKKLVNKLVRNALRKRTNITSAQVVRKRGGVAASTLAARRNIAVRRNVAAARTVVQQPVRTVIQRAAPVRTVVQHVQPVPVRVIRQTITAPPAETRVVRRGPPPQFRRNDRQQQNQPRTVVVQQVQRQQGRRFGQNNNNRRNNNVDRPTVIRRQVVQQAPRRVQVRPQYQEVVQRVVRRGPPQQQQQFQRPQQTGRNNVRYVNPGGRRAQGQRRSVVQQVQQVQRYHPVQYVTETVVPSRGRGFRGF